ncbi:MAG: methionyl-tRNA formyltransferase [Marinilabiliaceae bacterium]|nr:methionyl-tRNA formyltransferase [Marinilabiliaceae bacterium]
MGTPDFAVESLKALVENKFNIVGVITAPDKPAGRGQKLQQSPVKEYALSRKLNILQPLNLKDPVFINELKSLNADLQIVVAFRMLPESVWNMPKLGTFNLHASLLPHYRGAAPINWAVINGDKETGITTFFIQHEIDTGSILFQEKVPINFSDNAGIVHDKLMTKGASLVVKTVNAIQSGKTNPIPQNKIITHEPLKNAPKIFKETCQINWNQDAIIIYNFIRGLSPYPGAWTNIINEEQKTSVFKIFDTELITSSCLTPSEIETDGKTYIIIGCKNGALKIKNLQIAGKKRMQIDEFLRGNNIHNYHLE